MYSIDAQSTVRIVQITDTHLNATDDGHLLGMNTRQSLCYVLELIQKSKQQSDLLLLTGDLSQDGSLASYQFLEKALNGLESPSFWLPGNHDNPIAYASVASEGTRSERLIRTKHWQLVLLDSQVPGKVYGGLSSSELAFLEQCLSDQPDLHTLVAFHHHPLDVGCRWMQGIGIRNSDALFEVLGRHSNVKSLLWGHVHQAFDQTLNGIRMLATPSTCVQFVPGSDEFSVDSQGPGYRWLDLMPDGTIETGIERVDHIEFEIDYSVKGY